MLEVEGDLTIESAGVVARVEARGDTIRVELPGLRSTASFLGGRRRFRVPVAWIHRAHESLLKAGLTLRVEIGSRTIARLGAGARPGLISRLFRLGPLEFRLGGLFGRSRRPTDRPES